MILLMLAKGMTPREIVTIFPELALADIPAAALQTAELLKDPDASLEPFDASLHATIERVRQRAELSEEDAMDLAVAETREHRRDKAARKGT